LVCTFATKARGEVIAMDGFTTIWNPIYISRQVSIRRPNNYYLS
jgi:hypothetical protein